MKTIALIITILSFFCINNPAYAVYTAAQENCYITTPKGSVVHLRCFWDKKEKLSPAKIAAFNQAATTRYPNASKIADASMLYNCHSYAWWWASTSNYAWMNSPNDDIFWNDGSYVRTTNWNEATHTSYTSSDHSALNYSGHIGWMISKWGQWPLMVHWYTHCPYNATGGSSVNLYKRR